jgi:hypothetical protein
VNEYDVDRDEMTSDPFDDECIEALLSGSDGGPFLALGQEVDVVLSGPAPAPRGDLAALLRDGFRPPDATPVQNPWAPPPRPEPTAADRPSPRRRSRLVPRLAALGLAAKVGLGVGVAAAGVTGAGAAGVLPAPVQHVVASVVDTVTPFQLPDPVPEPAVVTPGPSGGVPSGGSEPGAAVDTGAHQGSGGAGSSSGPGSSEIGRAHV